MSLGQDTLPCGLTLEVYVLPLLSREPGWGHNGQRAWAGVLNAEWPLCEQQTWKEGEDGLFRGGRGHPRLT